MKTILHLSDPDIFIKRWIESNIYHFKKVYLVCFFEDKIRAEKCKINLISNVEIIYLKYSKPYGYLLNVFELKKVIKKIKPDILHAHYATGMGTLGRLCNFDGIKILSILGSDVLLASSKNKLFRFLVKKNLENYNHLFYTSNFMESSILKLHQKSINKMTRLPYGIPNQFFKHNDRNINKDKFIITIVKRVDPIYGIDIAIKVISLFKKWLQESSEFNKKIYNNFELNIFGNGNYIEEYTDLVKKLNLENEVNFRGFINNDLVPEVLSSSNLSLNLSRSESFGVFVLESQACGVPVIASNIGGIPETMLDNQTGYLVDPNNLEQILEKIKILYIDKKLNKQFSENAKKFVKETYDWEKNSMKIYYKTISKLYKI